MRNADKVRDSENTRRRNRRAGIEPAVAVEKSLLPEIIAIDGEGVTINGYHDYRLMISSTGDVLSSDNELEIEQIAAFLHKLKNDHPKSVIVGYGTGYDVNMWLQGLSSAEVAEVRAGRPVIVTPLSPDGPAIRIHWIPRTWVDVGLCHWDEAARKWVSDANVRVFDLHKWFQMPFVAALKKWGYPHADIISTIQTNKNARATFSTVDANLVRYCSLEVVAMQWLAQQLGEAAIRADMPLKSWHGAGAVAGKVLRNARIHEQIRVPVNAEFHGQSGNAEDWHHWVMSAYFGGRIQTLLPGEHFTSYLYDLNSAYGWGLRQLPSMHDIAWRFVTPRRPRYAEELALHPLDIALVSWDCPPDSHVCPFPFRTRDGNIEYPRAGMGYYFGVEVNAAAELHPESITVHAIMAAEYDPRRAMFPFNDVIGDIYQRRREKADSGDANAAFILKSAIAAIYGKLAQGDSVSGRQPRYRSYYYAGFITASVRALLLSAVRVAPEQVIAFSTDGMLMRSPIELPTGKGLGQWRAESFGHTLALQPGVFVAVPGAKYPLQITNVPLFAPTSFLYEKRRGFPYGSIDWGKAVEEWRKHRMNMRIPVEVDRFVGLRQSQPDLSDWATWKRETLMLRATLGSGLPAPDAVRARGMLHWPVRGLDYGGKTSRPYLSDSGATIAARDTESEQRHRL